MRFGKLILLSSIAVSLAVPAVAATRARRGPTAARKTSAKHAAAKPHTIGQRTIDDERATQIQSALIKAGYLTGSPSGRWDAESEAAMGRLQADNGWQTKLVPDSRALIKLGLGPAAASANPPSPTAAIASPAGNFASTADSFAAAQ